MKTQRRRYVVPGHHRKILTAVRKLAKNPITRSIAKEVKLHISGVSQSLKALARHNYIKHIGGKSGDMQWQLLEKAQKFLMLQQVSG